MLVTELIFFTVSAMIGILLYWRESKNNALYRMLNRVTHAENLQMKPSERKGFLFQQPFLIRLVVIALLFLAIALTFKFLTPVPFRFELFTSSVVGAILGTYFASLVVFTNEKIDGGHETIDDSIEKGKGFIKEMAADVKGKAQEIKEKIEDKLDFDDNDDLLDVPKSKSKANKPAKKVETPKKSGRERLKDKGLL